MNQKLSFIERSALEMLKLNLDLNTKLGGFVINDNRVEIVDRKRFQRFSALIFSLIAISLLGVLAGILVPFL